MSNDPSGRRGSRRSCRAWQGAWSRSRRRRDCLSPRSRIHVVSTSPISWRGSTLFRWAGAAFYM